jgi:oxygen-independent coproporphyrinogen-3 oxidase
MDIFFQALHKEIVLMSKTFKSDNLSTIYFGGGTPSLMKKEVWQGIFEKIYESYKISKDCEITVELNPEDITLELCSFLKSLGVNRLSIGVQSFNDDVLRLMNRRHNAEKGVEAIQIAKNVGFSNISIDFIYGIKGFCHNNWEDIIKVALKYGVEHISAYHLTIEEGTRFGEMVKSGKEIIVSEDESIKQYFELIKAMKKYGFEHYEVSNFAVNRKYSQHNISYWNEDEYLGLGPSAHSFDKKERRWNFSNINRYIDCINSGLPWYETEQIGEITRINEYFLTHLRTMWGINIDFIKTEFGQQIYDFSLKRIYEHTKSGDLLKKNGNFVLSEKGFLKADMIIEDFFVV